MLFVRSPTRGVLPLNDEKWYGRELFQRHSLIKCVWVPLWRHLIIKRCYLCASQQDEYAWWGSSLWFCIWTSKVMIFYDWATHVIATVKTAHKSAYLRVKVCRKDRINSDINTMVNTSKYIDQMLAKHYINLKTRASGAYASDRLVDILCSESDLPDSMCCVEEKWGQIVRPRRESWKVMKPTEASGENSEKPTKAGDGMTEQKLAEASNDRYQQKPVMVDVIWQST